MTPPDADLLRVLQGESAWLHRLARRLARDPERAADAAQRTLLAALERRPEERGSLRAWLGTVLRRALREERRGDARRAEREALASAPRRPNGPEETLARLDVQQRVVAAIRALDEPYRSTLVQRFLDGRSVREIARREGLPPKTVHTRVERGLARLRARLDRAYGGDRSAWLGALVALRLDSIGPLAKGLGAMQAGTKAWAATAAVVAVLGSAAWWWQGTSAPGGEVEPAAVARVEPRPAELAGERPEEPAAEPARAALALDPVPDEAEPAAAPVELLTGRVEDLRGLPVEGARVRYVDESGAPLGPEPARTDARGAFALPLPDEGADAHVVAERAGYALLARPVLRRPLPEAELVLTLVPAAPVTGFVVDEQASPVAGARVDVSVPSALFNAHTGGAWVYGREDWSTTSGAAGAFRIEGAPLVEPMRARAERDGYVPASETLETRAGVQLVLRGSGAGARVVAGVVLDESGAPVAAAHVSAGRDSVSTDAEGRFALELAEGATGATVELCALKPGALPAREEVAAEAHGFPFVTLRLGGVPLAIRGRALDAEGEPVAGAVVSLLAGTRFGNVPEVHGGLRVAIQREVEELLGGATRATADARGRFALEGLLPRSYELVALDPRTLSGAGPVAVDAGREGLELRLVGLGERRAVAGRVVTSTGAPIPGVNISVGRRVDGASIDYRMPTVARTDEAGRFAVEPLHVRDAYLVLNSLGLTAPVRIDLDEREDLSSLELVAGVVCYARVALAEPGFADSLAFLDAEGEKLNVGFEVPGATFVSRNVGIDAGQTGTLRTDDRARTLVLSRDGEEVHRRPVELVPGAEVELRVP